MIVLDASALANALTDDGALGEAARTELSKDLHWSAPQHLFVEAFSAIRGRLLDGWIVERRARDAMGALGELAIDFVPIAGLLDRMWELRHNLTGYDAAYAVAAEMQECTLVTADRRLAQATGLPCPVRLAMPA